MSHDWAHAEAFGCNFVSSTHLSSPSPSPSSLTHEMASAELAATYAALILADDGVEITSDKIVAITNAAGVELEPIWASLLAKALEGKNVKDLDFLKTSLANTYPSQSDKILAVTNAANVELEPIWASLLAKALEGKNVKDLLSNVGGGGAPAAAAPAAAAAGGAAPAEAAKEEKKEEEKEESDDDMGFGLFD
ncbi:unnamed protein product [Rhizoctonia solani]|uniref:60S acidic ribosomal protein P1 n=1 Tax=Rhizoctonia solani TaxID=456999 RepID=A0A8H3CDF9_9AGAM|nr:unnamed protein product [Rhizoctonia solani]